MHYAIPHREHSLDERAVRARGAAIAFLAILGTSIVVFLSGVTFVLLR